MSPVAVNAALASVLTGGLEPPTLIVSESVVFHKVCLKSANFRVTLQS